MKYNLSEISEVIQNRRTIKPENYNSREVHKEIIWKSLDNARWAPTHGMTQPWRFCVFTKESKNKLGVKQGDIYKLITEPDRFISTKYDRFVARAESSSAIISLCMSKPDSDKIPEIEEIEAVACAVQNMQLTLTAYGIGCYWSSGSVAYSQEMKDYLSISEKDKCLGFLYLGYPSKEWPKGQRRPVEYFTEWRD